MDQRGLVLGGAVAQRVAALMGHDIDRAPTAARSRGSFAPHATRMIRPRSIVIANAENSNININCVKKNVLEPNEQVGLQNCRASGVTADWPTGEQSSGCA